MNLLKMGYYKVDITPDHSLQMIGFGRLDEWSRGILKPLIAQITVWQTSDTTCCFIVIDHIGFSREHANELRDQIAQQLHIQRQQVMLMFTHTHAAPNESADINYYDFICTNILSGLTKACESLQPVLIAWGNTTADIGINRRKGSQLLDYRIGTLKVTDESNQLKMILLRIPVHNNVLKGDNYLLSPDFFGEVRDVLQDRYHCPILVTQGASGDIAPKYFQSELTPPDANDERFVRSKTALMDMADLVLQSVDTLLPTLLAKPTNQLFMYSNEITLYAEVPSYEQALAVAKEAKDICGINETNWLKEVQRLNSNGITKQPEVIEVQYLKLGNGCLCGVPNEILCDFALKTMTALKNEFFYFGGYTNGCTAYFPTEEEFDLGGYEVYWSLLDFFMYHGRVYPLMRDSASQLIRFVIEHYIR